MCEDRPFPRQINDVLVQLGAEVTISGKLHSILLFYIKIHEKVSNIKQTKYHEGFNMMMPLIKLNEHVMIQKFLDSTWH